jgi:hypothetical protein
VAAIAGVTLVGVNRSSSFRNTPSVGATERR